MRNSDHQKGGGTVEFSPDRNTRKRSNSKRTKKKEHVNKERINKEKYKELEK